LKFANPVEYDDGIWEKVQRHDDQGNVHAHAEIADVDNQKTVQMTLVREGSRFRVDWTLSTTIEDNIKCDDSGRRKSNGGAVGTMPNQMSQMSYSSSSVM
jgi:hypothetical protein